MILERIESQNRMTIEAAMKAVNGRFDRLEVALRELRVSVQQIGAEVHELRTKVQENSADIRDLAARMGALSRLEERVAALESS